jgi:hypothetical protein
MGTIRDDGSVDYIDHADDAIFKDVTPIEEDTPKLEESEPMTIPDPDDVAPLPFDMGDQQSIEQMFFG